MSDLTGAVAKTMNFVFADIETPSSEIKKRISSLKANISKVATIALEEIESLSSKRTHPAGGGLFRDSGSPGARAPSVRWVPYPDLSWSPTLIRS